MNRGGSERGRHRIWNRLQALSCQHRAWHGARTHGLLDHDLNQLSHPAPPWFFFFIKKIFLFLTFICFWDREHEQGRGRERGRHRIWSRLQALSCQHRAQGGDGTHEPQDHDLSWNQESDAQLTEPLSHLSKYTSFNVNPTQKHLHRNTQNTV